MARKRKATGGSGTLGAANHSLSGSNYGSGSGNGKGPKRHHPNGFRGGDDFNDGRGGRGEGGGSLGLAGAFTATRGYTDPVTGQRGAFPGLDDGGDGFFCGPAYSGMDYLRMVRYVIKKKPAFEIIAFLSCLAGCVNVISFPVQLIRYERTDFILIQGEDFSRDECDDIGRKQGVYRRYWLRSQRIQRRNQVL